MAEPAQRVFEVSRSDLPALVHPGWTDAFPWLVQGTTTRGDPSSVLDFGLFSGGAPETRVRESWRELARRTGADAVVHARQVHEATVRVWSTAGQVGTGGSGGQGSGGFAGAGPAGRSPRASGSTHPRLVDPCDGHATDVPGVVLAVTTADCVPVSVVDSRRRAVAMLHAGWRGAAAGVLEGGVETMRSAYGTAPDDLHVHLGPAICGDCYEVGPEVFDALGLPRPGAPTPLDLRAALLRRAVAAGVRRERVTISGHCTLCGGSGLFSHRGGDPHRHVGFLGIRAGGRLSDPS